MEHQSTSESVEAQAESSKNKKLGLTKVLPSDRLAFDRQVEAIKAFAAEYEANGGNPVTNEKAGGINKMAAATIIVTNAFFCDIGLLSRTDKGFIPSEEALNFMRAIHGLSPETAGEKLKSLFSNQWFSQVLIPRLRMRPLDIREAVIILGEESRAGKEHQERIEILIEFLNFVGLIRKEGSQIFLANTDDQNSKPTEISKNNLNDSQSIPNSNFCELPLPLDARTGRLATLKFPNDLTPAEVHKLINLIKLSFDHEEVQK